MCFGETAPAEHPVGSSRAPGEAVWSPFGSQCEVTLLPSAKFLLVISLTVIPCLWESGSSSALRSPTARAARERADSSCLPGNHIFIPVQRKNG